LNLSKHHVIIQSPVYVKHWFIFIVWESDAAPIKKRRLVSSNKAAVKNAFAGVLELYATDNSEFAEWVENFSDSINV
jgi:hypothetical protein